MQLIFHTPVNSLSLGQIGYNLLRECYKRGYDVGWHPVGQTDLSAYKVDQSFVDWLQKSANQRYDFLGKDLPAVVNWHLNQSERLYSRRQILCTYCETDTATNVEKSIVRNQHRTLFCGGYSEKVFRAAGLNNVGSFDLGFDEDFHITGKKYLEGRVHFGLIGKWEFRKNTEGIIKAWVKKFGNNPKYSLTCLVNNPFLSAEDNKRLILNALGGKNYWNCNFLPHIKTNEEMNALYNSIDIDLSGASYSESWGLPAFNATCLGKWSVVTNYGGHQAWANAENSILLEPEGSQECYDNVFFRKGGEFSQGNFSSYNEDNLIACMEKAEMNFGIVNSNGLQLKDKLNYSNTLNQILDLV